MRFLFIFMSLLSLTQLFAANGLVIHATEIGVAKFHRYDNDVHPYGNNHAWSPYILPKDAKTTTPLVIENSDHSVTIVFSTLEELLQKMVEVGKARNQRISVLNLHGHGLPGGMWFPANQSMMSGFGCWQWNSAAKGSDKGNYDQYYSPVSKQDILSLRSYSQTGGNVPCVTGLSEWKQTMAKVPGVKALLSQNMRINFLSCLVGLGPVGDSFTKGLAALLYEGQGASVRSSLYLGLGDWSMPEGMYPLSDARLVFA